ncbi:hypothetical protein [Nesterenkonia rhizosphaerae]|uniref:Uncharacterized protein n=1 Tax=Nesterenkonia rhizosphaerae TaxID=1348272 RepID=A0ABP9FQ55_9MICC
MTVTLRRSAAVLSAGSGLLHLAMMGHGPVLLSLVMALMALVCMPCAGHLWRSARLRTWITVGSMNLSMLLLHLAMLSAGAHRGADVEDLSAGRSGIVLTHHHESAWSFSAAHQVLFGAATMAAAAVVLLSTLAAGIDLHRRYKDRLSQQHI